MLIIKKDGSMELDQVLVEFNSNDQKTDFLIGQLNIPVQIETGVSVIDLVQAFYPLKDFIYSYFSEKYELTRALLTIKNIQGSYKYVKFYKSSAISEGYFYLEPCAELIANYEDNSNNIYTMADLMVIISEEFTTISEEDFDFKFVSKSKFTLLDLLTSLFEYLPDLLKEEANFSQ